MTACRAGAGSWGHRSRCRPGSRRMARNGLPADRPYTPADAPPDRPARPRPDALRVRTARDSGGGDRTHPARSSDDPGPRRGQRRGQLRDHRAALRDAHGVRCRARAPTGPRRNRRARGWRSAGDLPAPTGPRVLRRHFASRHRCRAQLAQAHRPGGAIAARLAHARRRGRLRAPDRRRRCVGRRADRR